MLASVAQLNAHPTGDQEAAGERMCTILANHLEDCPVKVWLGKLTTLNMTPLGWLGYKTST